MNANWNAKRESINSGEADLNDDILTPLIENMLNERQMACEKINAMFGTEISVELSGIWMQNKKQEILETKIMEAETGITEESQEGTQTEEAQVEEQTEDVVEEPVNNEVIEEEGE